MIQPTLRALAVTLALSAGAARAIDVQTSGYFRESLGFNSSGGGQACFQLPGADFKARLGNECDHYFELSFVQGAKVGKVEWRYEVMPSLWLQSSSGGGGSPVVRLAQSWGSLRFDGWGGVTLWAGNRYYRRHNVDPLDWFYWNPAQGHVFVGVEDVGVRYGKVALAIGRADSLGFTSAQTGAYVRVDARAYDFALSPDGTLEVGLDVDVPWHQSGANPGSYDPGVLVTLQHNQARFLGGSNALTFQYAQASFAGGATSGIKEWRVIENLTYAPVPRISGGASLVYQNKSFPTGGWHAIAIDLRPAYHVNNRFKVAVDACYQVIFMKDAPEGAGSPGLLKVTVAPTITVGRGLYVRPELRAFVTYATWSEAAAAAAGTGSSSSLGQGAFGEDQHGLSFGAQYELWF